MPYLTPAMVSQRRAEDLAVKERLEALRLQRLAQKDAVRLQQEDMNLRRKAMEDARLNSVANRNAQWWAQANAAEHQRKMQQQDYINQSDFARGQQERAYLEARRGRRADERRRRRMLREGREDQTTAFDRQMDAMGYQSELDRQQQREYQDLYRRNLLDAEAQKARDFMARDMLQADIGLRADQARFDQDLQRLARSAELGDDSASRQLRERYDLEQQGLDAAQMRGREDLDYRTAIEDRIREGERRFGRLKDSRARIDEMVSQGWMFSPEDEAYIRQIKANIRRSQTNPNLNADQKAEAIGHWEDVLDAIYPTISPRDRDIDIEDLFGKYTRTDPGTGARIGIDPRTNQFYKIADKPREYAGSGSVRLSREQEAEDSAIDAFQKEHDEWAKNPYVVGPEGKMIARPEPTLQQTRARRGLPVRGASGDAVGAPSGPRTIYEAESMLQKSNPEILEYLQGAVEDGQISQEDYVQQLADLTAGQQTPVAGSGSAPGVPPQEEEVDVNPSSGLPSPDYVEGLREDWDSVAKRILTKDEEDRLTVELFRNYLNDPGTPKDTRRDIQAMLLVMERYGEDGPPEGSQAESNFLAAYDNLKDSGVLMLDNPGGDSWLAEWLREDRELRSSGKRKPPTELTDTEALKAAASISWDPADFQDPENVQKFMKAFGWDQQGKQIEAAKESGEYLKPLPRTKHGALDFPSQPPHGLTEDEWERHIERAKLRERIRRIRGQSPFEKGKKGESGLSYKGRSIPPGGGF